MLLESTRGGLRRYLDALPKHGGNCGAVVMNCAPFTLGHQYLVDQARQACDWLYVFVLSEAKGMFPPEDRLELVRQGCQAYSNVSVHPTMGYLISNATFPTYFLKDQNRGGEISCQLDLEIFASRFAPALGLRKRFVGTEPLDPVTGRYNEALQSFLPGRESPLWRCPGWRPRRPGKRQPGSRVPGFRRLALLQQLVPHTTFAYLKSKLGG